MFNKVIPIIASIKVKLFLWFWLITICSIAITRFISIQLSEDMITMPIHEHDLRQLNGLVNMIERENPSSIDNFITKLKKRRKHDFKRHLWIKDLNSNQLWSTSKRHNLNVEHFVQNTDLTKQNTWQFSTFRVTGPLKTSINNVPVQLFFSQATKNPKHLSMAFRHLPIWQKITIPFIISVIFCWLLARSLSRPMSNISKVATQLGEGDFSVRLPKEEKRNDELGHLAKSFNTMADKLEQSITAQQRLLGDVSHELRSPLTRLQMAIGLIQTSEHDVNAREKYLARCELEVSRLDKMIGDVLALSRLENTLQHANIQSCDISQLISVLVEDATFVANEKNVTVAYHGSKNIILNVDSQLLASAIGNILNNAVKYSPEGSIVDIDVTCSSKKVTITVSDNGTGVPQEALSQLFDPFYRVAQARDRNSGGTGLGLAIAKQAVQLHHGHISAENKHDGGLRITVELPK